MNKTQALKMFMGVFVAPTMIITPLFFIIYCLVLMFTEGK